MRPDGKGGGSVQKPVRYYILQAEDQPVVRSVPVAVPNKVAVRQPEVPAPGPTIAAPDAGRARVTRLVRAAMRRNRQLRQGR